jgi:hypothetical protein
MDAFSNQTLAAAAKLAIGEYDSFPKLINFLERHGVPEDVLSSVPVSERSQLGKLAYARTVLERLNTPDHLTVARAVITSLLESGWPLACAW